MNAETLLARLDSVQRYGSGWMARCPAHADKNPSLSLKEEHGKVLLHCFAGCTVEAICAMAGIAVRDLFSTPHAPSQPMPQIVRDAQRDLTGLRSRLTRRDRERRVTLVVAEGKNVASAIARALALAVEGELVQVAYDGNSR
jgi:hypothetical protein